MSPTTPSALAARISATEVTLRAMSAFAASMSSITRIRSTASRKSWPSPRVIVWLAAVTPPARMCSRWARFMTLTSSASITIASRWRVGGRRAGRARQARRSSPLSHFPPRRRGRAVEWRLRRRWAVEGPRLRAILGHVPDRPRQDAAPDPQPQAAISAEQRARAARIAPADHGARERPRPCIRPRRELQDGACGGRRRPVAAAQCRLHADLQRHGVHADQDVRAGRHAGAGLSARVRASRATGCPCPSGRRSTASTSTWWSTRGAQLGGPHEIVEATLANQPLIAVVHLESDRYTATSSSRSRR